MNHYAHFLSKILFALMISGLVGCSQDNQKASPAPNPLSTPQQVPKSAVQLPIAKPALPSAPQVGGIFKGTGPTYNAPQNAQITADPGNGEITLNFENADIKDVAKIVLGDFLKANYIVDPQLQGSVTIKTSAPLPRAKVLPAFEEALRMSNMALIQSSGTYRIAQSQNAAREVGHINLPQRSREPGYGVEIVPLRYVNAAEVQKAIEPISKVGSLISVDKSRNMIVIAGTAQERQSMVDNIRTFDVNYLKGMSFGLFPLKAAEAKTLIEELQSVIGADDGVMGGLVKFIAIERMNAILAISPQGTYLEDVQVWIERLDQATGSVDRRIYVYRVQNGRAADLAKVIGQILGIKQTGGESSSGYGPGGGYGQPNSGNAGGYGGSSYGSSGTLSGRPLPGGGGTLNLAPPLADPFSDENGASSEHSDQSSEQTRITADETNNALLIYATPLEYQNIEAALKELDIVPMQVLLEAAIAEVTLTNNLRYGVQHFFNTNNGTNQFVNTISNSTAIGATLPGFAYLLSMGANIRVILSALESMTDVNVVSSPQLFVLNNQTATLQVGDQVPVATQSAVAVQNPGAPIVNTIEFKDTGVILKVTPRVNDSGLVLMDVTQEVSDVVGTTTSQIDSPTIQQRKISSTVAVMDGQTIALGGLIRDTKNVGKSGLPFLQRIPYAGNLFATTADNNTRTELVILITPRVVTSQQRSQEVTNELRRKLKATADPLSRLKRDDLPPP